MEAKQLMIGDWVKIQDTPKYYKIVGMEIMPKGDACRLKYDEYRVDTWCDRIFPIPLTEEILKVNFGGIGSADIPCLSVLVNGNTYCNRLNYVHELQHTLRLCGLNELADNFKIE